MHDSSTLGKVQKRLLLLLVCCASVAGCTMGTTVTGNLPSGVSASALSTSSIRVYWTRNTADITTDTVIVMLGSNIVATVPAPYLGSTNDSATVTGLAASTQYTIIIGSEAGESSPYDYTLQLTYLPTNVAVIAEDSLSITVTWTRNFNDTSTDTLEVTTPDGAYAGDAPILVPPGKDTGVVTELMPGITYDITVVCSTGSLTAITYTIPGVPTNVRVNSMSATSIGVQWTRGVGDTLPDIIVAMNGGTVVSTTSVPYGVTANDTTGVVSGLNEKVPYLICVHVSTGISDSIIWMTAERTTGLKIYEMSDNAGDPRGLQLTSPAAVALTLPNAAKPDFILNTNSLLPSGISLDAGDSAGVNGDSTKVNPNYILVPGGLDSNFNLSNYWSDTAYEVVTPVIIPADLTYGPHASMDSGNIARGSMVLVCQTVNDNFALIEIVPDPNSGQLYSTASNGFKYITVNVSYQASTNQPYAGRGHPRSTKPVLKKPSATARPAFRNSPSSTKPVMSAPASSVKPVMKSLQH